MSEAGGGKLIWHRVGFHGAVPLSAARNTGLDVAVEPLKII